MHREFRPAESDLLERKERIVDWSVLAALNERFSAPSRRASIFPRLRRLSFHVYGWEKRPLAFILSCLSPMVTGLEITDAYTHVADPDIDLGPSVSVKHVFLYVAAQCPLLVLTQDDNSLSEPMGSAPSFMDTIPRARQLRSISMHIPVETDTVLALGAAQGIIYLSLSPHNLQLYAAPPMPPLFESLQDLHLSVPGIETFTSFLSFLPAHIPLRKVYVGIDLIPWREDSCLRRCCELFGRHRSLEHISIEFSRLIRQPFSTAVTFETFAHLLAFPNVRTFHFSPGAKSPALITLNTFDFTAMGQAWVKLRYLKLHGVVLEGQPTRLCNMDALLAYREYLPSLETLEVALDATADCSHIPAAVLESKVSSHPLRVLDLSALTVQPRRISEPATVARALYALFPNLEKLLYFSRSGEDWALVEKVLSELPDSRLVSSDVCLSPARAL